MAAVSHQIACQPRAGAARIVADDRGIALLMVLWVFMVLTVLVGEFGRTMRDDAVATQNLAEEVQARAIAMAGINTAIYKGMRARETNNNDPRQNVAGRKLDQEPMDVWMPDGKPHEGTYGGGKYTVRLFDEGAKIGINRADENLLRRVFSNLGIDRKEQDNIVDAILDWRDSDSLRRVHGAEEEYYTKLPEPYRPKNGPLDSVEEMLLIRGISHDLFYGIVEEKFGRDEIPPIPLPQVFSVFNRTGNINIRFASPAVLRVLLQEEEDVEEVIEARDADPDSALKIMQAKVADPFIIKRLRNSANPSTVAVDARASMASGHLEARIGAVIDVPEDGDGFHIARWYDRLPAR